MKTIESPREASAPMPHRSAAPVSVGASLPERAAPAAPGQHAIAELPMPVRAGGTARRAEDAEGAGAMVPADPLAGALTVRGGSAGRLEQIVERAVARRVAEAREEWEASQPRAASQPEPAGRVVVVRASGREKMPSAFWERSYLNRFRIMTLR